ncbi:MAG: potassium channel protein [Sandaracinus sp.]
MATPTERRLQDAIEQQLALRTRLFVAAGWLVAVVVVGASGFHVIGGDHWSWGDCFYFTIITLSTVGFGETLTGLHEHPYARLWTVGLIVLGSGTLVYFVSTLTAFIVEGDIRDAFRRNRMRQVIDKLEGHYIVCGAGTTGIHVIEEFIQCHVPFVVVDRSRHRLSELHERFDRPSHRFLYVVGDGTDDHVLEEAGIARCRGIVAALSEDKDNLFVTVTASALNPKARIIAKCVEVSARPKLLRAGARAVVSPTQIGGLRLASEAIRPTVVEFLDLMLRDPNQNLRIEEVTIPESSSLVGLPIRDTNIRQKTKGLVIAVRFADGRFAYNPEPGLVLEHGSTLVVLAEVAEMRKLRDGLADGTIGKA